MSLLPKGYGYCRVLQKPDITQQLLLCLLSAQAISLWKATSIGIFHRRDRKHKCKKPQYDYDKIKENLDFINSSHSGWEGLFEECRIESLRIIYEDFINDIPGTVKKIADFLGVPLDKELKLKTDFLKMSDTYSKKMCARFIGELKGRGEIP